MFRPLLLGFVLALTWAGTSDAADVVIRPEDDLAKQVSLSPPGTRFVFSPGKHYAGDISPKRGQSFIGQPGAILSGAIRLGEFARDGRAWRVKGPRPLDPSGGECERADRSCFFGEVLFVDGRPLRRVLKLGDLNNEAWLQNRENGDVVVGFDPAGRLIEMSYRRSAFSGPAQDVTIQGFIIEQYASIAQQGAIHALWEPTQAELSSGWQVLGNDIRFNSGAGVRFGNKMRLTGNRVYMNGQIGIRGSGTGIVVDSNEIFANNTLGYLYSWEAGATKFELTDSLTVRNNCVHDNLGNGIWTDGENRNSTIGDNWSVRNRGVGIFHEISGRAAIERNTVAFNGSPGETPWNSQILVSGSIDTVVQGNRVEVSANSGNAIFVVEEGRKKWNMVHLHDYPTYVSRRNVVTGNHVTFYRSTGVSGFQSNGGRVGDLVDNNRFEGNSIRVVDGTDKRFRIGSDYLDLKQAQERGQEVGSLIVSSPLESPPDLQLKCPSGVGRGVLK
ncbi:Right handed beta helix region [Rhodospirillales bacterium URHD0017]|nr:Right handed beta helix region [Rhodospirillales bacterium URHD0017]